MIMVMEAMVMLMDIFDFSIELKCCKMKFLKLPFIFIMFQIRQTVGNIVKVKLSGRDVVAMK